MSDEKSLRYRFTVPVGDAYVNDWISQQSNLGFSLRILIKAFIRDHGIQDVTCLELGVNVKRRGRPSKLSKQEMDGVFEDDSSIDSQEDIESDNRVTDRQNRSNSVAAKPVTTRTDNTVHEDTDNDDALDNILGTISQTKQVESKPVKPTQQTPVEEIDSDDGFVDPMSLLN